MTAEKFNWLKAYSRLLDNTEVPPRFTIWTGIATLLSCLETRIYIHQGNYVIRPNFFMVLVAGSGLKKSTAISLPSRLIRQLDPKPRVISQKITPEALIVALKEMVQADQGKKSLASKSGGIVIADELSTFLDRNSLEKGLGPMLTTLFDCGPFEYTTLGRGTDKLENSYLSLLGGTTVELLRNSLPKDAIGGGFTSRTLFIYEDKRPDPVPWVDVDEQLIELEAELVKYLQTLMELKGPVVVTPEARAYYEADYVQRYNSIGEQPGLAQYENRRHAHLFKVAMAIMVSEEPRLTLTKQDLVVAKTLLEEAEEFLPRVMELLVASERGHSNNLLLQYITSKKAVSRTELVRRFAHQYNASEISQIIDTLVKSGQVEVDAIGSAVHYRIPGVK